MLNSAKQDKPTYYPILEQHHWVHFNTDIQVESRQQYIYRSFILLSCQIQYVCIKYVSLCNILGCSRIHFVSQQTCLPAMELMNNFLPIISPLVAGDLVKMTVLFKQPLLFCQCKYKKCLSSIVHHLMDKTNKVEIEF